MVFVRCEKQRGAPFEAFALQGQQVELPYTDEFGDTITSLVFELAGDAPRLQADGRNDRKAASSARLLDLLHELRDALSNGDKVTKEQWRDEAIVRGICSRTGFYRLSSELESRGAWHWWKNDCRTDTPENNSETVQRYESQKSQ
jgi:hypothetical protein